MEGLRSEGEANHGDAVIKEIQELAPEQAFANALHNLRQAVEAEQEAGHKVTRSRIQKGKEIHELETAARKGELTVLGELTPLQYARVWLGEDEGLNLGDSEVSMCRAAWTQVVEPLGGLDAHFQDYYNAKPYTEGANRPITDVPVNILYQIRRYAHKAPACVLSFARRMGEKNLGLFNKMLPHTMAQSQLHSHIKVLVEALDNGEPVKPIINGWLGQEDDPEVRSFTMLQEDYDHLYRPIKRRVSLILGALGLLPNGEDEVRDNQLMTWLFDAFVPDSPAQVFNLLVSVGCVDEGQFDILEQLWQEGLHERWDEIE